MDVWGCRLSLLGVVHQHLGRKECVISEMLDWNDVDVTD